MRRDLTPEESKEAIVPFIYDAATPRGRIDEDMAIRMKWYPTPQGYAGQLQGIFGWEAYSRIAHILAPTLLIHGETDRLVPPANAKLIAGRIPRAKLVLTPHASHIFETDQPGAAHRGRPQPCNQETASARGSDIEAQTPAQSCLPWRRRDAGGLDAGCIQNGGSIRSHQRDGIDARSRRPWDSKATIATATSGPLLNGVGSPWNRQPTKIGESELLISRARAN